MIRELSAALALCLAPIAASAQTSSAVAPEMTADQVSQGPMTVERIHNGFLAAPDFGVTEVNGKAAGLGGGYAGFVFEDAFFVGGAVKAQFTNTSNESMVYGGLLLQWFGRTNESVGFAAKTLLGWGTADSTTTVPTVQRGQTINQRVRYSQDFWVAEPGVDAVIRLSKNLRFTAGLGYRFTGHAWYGGYYGNPYYSHSTGLDGVVGSFGLHIGGGS